MLLRLAYLGVTNVFVLLRLLPVSNQEKDAEILALRHQLLVLQRQLGPGRVRFSPADWALLAALPHRLPKDVLKRLHLVVRPDTVLRWHRDMRVGTPKHESTGAYRRRRKKRSPDSGIRPIGNVLAEGDAFCQGKDIEPETAIAAVKGGAFSELPVGQQVVELEVQLEAGAPAVPGRLEQPAPVPDAPLRPGPAGRGHLRRHQVSASSGSVASARSGRRGGTRIARPGSASAATTATSGRSVLDATERSPCSNRNRSSRNLGGIPTAFH